MRKGVLISTTEHILSALIGMEIDNVVIEVDNLELPILDGSALPYIDLLRTAGRRRQRARRVFLKVGAPLEVVDGSRRICILPCDEFRITSHIDFPHPLVGRQTIEVSLDSDTYSGQIAPARTFGFISELPKLRDMGLVRGGSLTNAVVFDSDSVMNPGGLRFPDECGRHKVLDLIGDLALVGYPLLGHVIAERAGHAMHTALVLKLMKNRELWTLHTKPESSSDSLGKAARSETAEAAAGD